MNGVLSPWTREQYDADASRVRSTSMKALVSAQGPRAYLLKHGDQARAREPAADANDDYSPKVGPLVLGTLFHELVIDGRVGWCVNPHRRGTRDWKMACRRAANSGSVKVAVTPATEEMLLAWNEALLRNPAVAALLAEQRYDEQVITWEEEVTFNAETIVDPDADYWKSLLPTIRYLGHDGSMVTVAVASKCAIDIFTWAGRVACLKTTRIPSIENDAWVRELERMNYQFSAAFYERGVLSLPDFKGKSLEPMTHLVLCKPAPHYAYVQQLNDEFMRFGKQFVDMAYQRYARCMLDTALGIDRLAAWPDFLERNQLNPIGPSMRAMERYGELAGESV